MVLLVIVGQRPWYKRDNQLVTCIWVVLRQTQCALLLCNILVDIPSLVFPRPEPDGGGVDVPDVVSGARRSGTIRLEAESDLLPRLPLERRARTFLPIGSRRRVLQRSRRTALHPDWPGHTGGPE